MDYVCYVLLDASGRRSYAGCTNNLVRRLRQHNGELVGGAKATRTGRPWHLFRVVRGFGTDQRAALRVLVLAHLDEPLDDRIGRVAAVGKVPATGRGA